MERDSQGTSLSACAAPLWQPDELIAAVDGQWLSGGAHPWGAVGVSHRPRDVLPGHLFFADIFAPTPDDQLRLAFARGAVAAVIGNGHADLPPERPLFLVSHPRRALVALARAARRRAGARCVAVTGSVGKTTTRELLQHLLATAGPTSATLENENDSIGVALTLAQMPPTAAFAVFETTISKRMLDMADLVRPHAAVVTCIGPAHFGNWGSIEAIAEAKSLLFTRVDSDGPVVLPRDDAQFALLRARAERCGLSRVLSFGAHPAADVRWQATHEAAEGATVVVEIGPALPFPGQIDYRLQTSSRAVVWDSLAALAVAAGLGLDPRSASRVLVEFAPIAGRGRRHLLSVGDKPITLIDESFNANPLSMRAALATLAGQALPRGGRRIAVLGDMLELGDDALAFHLELVPLLLGLDNVMVFTVGPQMRAVREELGERVAGAHAESSAAMAHLLLERIAPGDVVMVKGSHAVRMETIVRALLTAGASRTGPV